MRGLRLRQRHLPQTSNKKYFRRKRLLTFGNFFFRSSIECCDILLRSWLDLSVKQSGSKLQNPFFSGLIEIPMPIGAVWIPFPSRQFYNQLANRLAIRVCLDEETLVALLNNFDADWLVRHSEGTE